MRASLTLLALLATSHGCTKPRPGHRPADSTARHAAPTRDASTIPTELADCSDELWIVRPNNPIVLAEWVRFAKRHPQLRSQADEGTQVNPFSGEQMVRPAAPQNAWAQIGGDWEPAFRFEFEGHISFPSDKRLRPLADSIAADLGARVVPATCDSDAG
jgi:hypothetical protein